jgi:hypothetical protein
MIRGWKKLSRKEELDVERERHRSRFLSVSPDEDGMYRVRGRLDPDVGALLMRALEAAGDALFRSDRDWAPEGGTRGPAVQEITPRQRRADGLGLVVEQAMRVGFGWRDGEGGKGDAEREGDEDASAETRHEPGACEDGPHGVRVDEAQRSEADRAPISGTRPERYQVVLHVDAATLRGNDGDGQGARTKGSISHVPGRSHLSDGTRVSAETSRRLCCDAGVVQAMRGSEGEVLDVGRRTRTIPPALRRALEIRDRGCRFPAHRPDPVLRPDRLAAARRGAYSRPGESPFSSPENPATTRGAPRWQHSLGPVAQARGHSVGARGPGPRGPGLVRRTVNRSSVRPSAHPPTPPPG